MDQTLSQIEDNFSSSKSILIRADKGRFSNQSLQIAVVAIVNEIACLVMEIEASRHVDVFDADGEMMSQFWKKFTLSFKNGDIIVDYL